MGLKRKVGASEGERDVVRKFFSKKNIRDWTQTTQTELILLVVVVVNVQNVLGVPVSHPHFNGKLNIITEL